MIYAYDVITINIYIEPKKAIVSLIFFWNNIIKKETIDNLQLVMLIQRLNIFHARGCSTRIFII